MADNPYIDSENYHQGYEKSIESLKNNPDIIELDKLCYLTFKTPHGERLQQKLDEKFLLPGLASPGNQNFTTSVVYFEGFKHALRMLKNCVVSHEQRIKAETEE